VFDELKALVAFAESGSMERAAGGLALTSSALTRRIQRLESELGVVLLDRHFKPPKLTPMGLEVLGKSRAILGSLGELKASTAGKAAPTGPFRLGISHALARPDISGAIIELGRRFPLLRPTVSNDVSRQLLARLHHGELDGALVVLPTDDVPPSDLEGVTIAREAMLLVQARSAPGRRRSGAPDCLRRSWILNPAGCLVREEIERRVERLGGTLEVAAELHDANLQLALIAANMGVGVVRETFLRTHALRDRVEAIDHPAFQISIRIAFFRARYLGARAQVARELERILLGLLSPHPSARAASPPPSLRRRRC